MPGVNLKSLGITLLAAVSFAAAAAPADAGEILVERGNLNALIKFDGNTYARNKLNYLLVYSDEQHTCRIWEEFKRPRDNARLNNLNYVFPLDVDELREEDINYEPSYKRLRTVLHNTYNIWIYMDDQDFNRCRYISSGGGNDTPDTPPPPSGGGDDTGPGTPPSDPGPGGPGGGDDTGPGGPGGNGPGGPGGNGPSGPG